MTNSSKIGNYYHYIANNIVKTQGFCVIIIMTILYLLLFIGFRLQILEPVDTNYSDPRMEELCSSKQASSIAEISEQFVEC